MGTRGSRGRPSTTEGRGRRNPAAPRARPVVGPPRARGSFVGAGLPRQRAQRARVHEVLRGACLPVCRLFDQSGARACKADSRRGCGETRSKHRASQASSFLGVAASPHLLPAVWSCHRKSSEGRPRSNGPARFRCAARISGAPLCSPNQWRGGLFFAKAFTERAVEAASRAIGAADFRNL